MRHLRTILVLLLLGAIINVAVAWGAVMLQYQWNRRQPDLFTVSTVHGPLPAGTEIWTWSGVGHMEVRPYFTSGGEIERTPYSGSVWWPNEALSDADVASCLIGAGWPMVSLMGWSSTHWEPPRADGLMIARPVWHDTTTLDGPVGPVPIPLLPIWPGLLVNVMFYTTLVGVLFLGARFVRTHIRSRSGRCPHCGYPRGESTVCPECGQPVKPITAQPHPAPPQP